MSKPKRIFLGMLVLLVLLVGLAEGARIALTPAMPEEWRGLHKGMTRDQILNAELGVHYDMLDTKGFDLFVRETTMLGRTCRWQLYVTYDRTGSINAEGRFIHPGNGMLSGELKRIL
ncbi:MAG: hypothetical protein EBS05_24190 [Proteobacteria bacterium]|nr:hypothetical protein [Pseudomonadota bacterium]NDF01038.1 hypothetical protein [Verrucomicrobiota bacterium]